MNAKFFLSQHKKFVEYVIKFFTSQVTDPPMYENILTVCQENSYAKSVNNTNHDLCLRLGQLSVSDFKKYYFEDKSSPNSETKGISSTLLKLTLDTLCECCILTREDSIFVGSDSTYWLSTGYVDFLDKKGAIDNLFWGFSFIVKKYQDSIFKIVINEEFDGIGTGFLVRYKLRGQIYNFIITNQHVAKHKFRIYDENETEFFSSHVYFAEKTDLAAILLASDVSREPFNFFFDAEVLDEVVVIGYPKIPLARNPYQVVHRGEINALLHDLWNTEHLLYSAMTNPGNSGGPILNKFGLVVGVATEQLRMQDDTTFQPYYAAVTAKDVVKFLNEEVFVGF